MQAILLFVLIYACSLGLPPSSLFQRSFTTATLISAGDPFTGADIGQVVVSLFYLAIVISTMASVAYRRPEASDNP
jgi:formate hydrogenlyase subunit 3/multisubunit Na+/H+ antiporter MnhD subunit